MNFWEQFVSAVVADVILLATGYALGFRITRKND